MKSGIAVKISSFLINKAEALTASGQIELNACRKVIQQAFNISEVMNIRYVQNYIKEKYKDAI